MCTSFGTFWQVWSLAKAHFVDPSAINPASMMSGAINGMLDSLGDQGHTRYLTADESKRWNEQLSGTFEGIGAYIGERDGKPIITAPIEGSPAEKAGIKAGDALLKVDDVDVTMMSSEDVVKRVRGPKNTSVRLTLQHEGDEASYDVTITRAQVETPSVSWRMLPNNVALVRLNQFASRSGDELQTALGAARTGGARTLVLDMRDNPGGLVNEALNVASQFLPDGSTVLLEADRSGTRTPLKTSSGGVALDIPMVVLVNDHTASSAEIVAGALQDAGRAKVIGVPTVGTGTVLSTYNLDDGSQLVLGTMQWLTPKGRLIRKEGITPDVKVALAAGTQYLTPAEAVTLSEQALQQSQDTQLVRALEILGGAAGN